MKISFIKPSMTGGPLGDAMEPLVFGILAGLTPPDVQLKLFDERIEPVNFDEPADLAAISCETYSAKRSYQIAARYRRRGVPVVIGGCHPTLWTEEVLSYADSVVVGDAEDTWPEVLADARRGSLKRIYRGRSPSLNGLRVDRSIFAGKRYGPMRLVQFGRGCPHGCDFCSIHALYGTCIRYRPVDEVIQEIKDLATKNIVFVDDNLFADRTMAVELIRGLKTLRARWSCQATVELAEDDDLLRMMAEAGCLSVVIGFESLNNENLTQMRKGQRQTSSRYEAAIRRFHDRGIMVYGSFVFGYDHDTDREFDRSLEFALHNRLFLANFNPLIPMPGTPLYARLLTENRLIHDPWWLDPTFRYGRAIFRPIRMSADELTAGIYRIRTAFNSLGGIARRALNLRANLRGPRNAGAFLAVNLINRREIHRKQGMLLGGPEPLEPIFAERACG